VLKNFIELCIHLYTKNVPYHAERATDTKLTLRKPLQNAGAKHRFFLSHRSKRNHSHLRRAGRAWPPSLSPCAAPPPCCRQEGGRTSLPSPPCTSWPPPSAFCCRSLSRCRLLSLLASGCEPLFYGLRHSPVYRWRNGERW
jgi:hypothetical protein